MHLKSDTSSAASHFASVPKISRSRNAFSIAEKHVSTIQFDKLYPMYWKMIYPGDTLSIAQKSLARLQTQIAPLYDDLYLDAHAWFVPLRLIQTNWARFQFNAQPAGPSQDNSSLTSPQLNIAALSSGFPSKSLYDYFGLPTLVNSSGSTAWVHNYLGRAYNLIWNQNYRDENLQNPVTVDLDEGPDDSTNYVLLARGKRHDRFTSCLPWAQKGAAVTLPLGNTAPVKADRTTPGTTDYPNFDVAGGNNNLPLQALTGAASAPVGVSGTAGGTGGLMLWGAQTGLYADLSTAVGATLNMVRTSFAIQHLLEADARGGTRDVESIAHRWGVTVPDFRLQRPEYIGGLLWSFDPNIVPQTSSTSGSSYQAGLTQFSQSMGQLNVNHSFVEHGIFMILISARSNLTYQQGIDRELSYKTRYDFYQPEFANLGEVGVLNKEIFFQGTDSADNGIFGYNEYGYWLRYGTNRVTGEMRSVYSTPLDSRHMAEHYTTLPTLGSGWIPSNTPISRNIAISAATADPIQFSLFVQGKIARTLPMYSIPGLTRL